MFVLVTGGAGFIGQHLVRALLARGDRVRVLDNFDDAYDPAQKAVPPGAELLRGDVTHAGDVATALAGVDGVVHLAARAGVRESLADPALYAHVNVVGTATLLAGMQRAGVRRLVFASSSSVYGAAPGPFRETDPADRPASPYAASKRAAETFVVAAGLDATIARLFTVYGPGQRPGMAIARFVRLAQAGEPIPVFGDLASVRDYTWVDDTVDGLIRGLDRASGCRIVNLGAGRPVPLSEVLEAIAAATGRELRLDRQPVQPGDVPLTHADPTVAATWLGWRAQTPFAEGIRRYVATTR